MKILKFIILTTLLLGLSFSSFAQDDPLDPFDNWNFSFNEDPFGPSPEDETKSAEQLVREASILLEEERLLDARTKLLKALKNDPKYYQAHILLSGYYIRHVGHFRLSLKYIKRALELFYEEHSSPPYSDLLLQAQHAHMLYIYSQARLNLDNYQGALDILDEYESYGYFHDWYPGSRAWILMKLGRLDDAIKTARLGILQGAEPGRTLNMLGILLSMTGEREESLRVFKEAIRYELSLGISGQPATPLNNSGEVYKEIFFDEKAESSWLKATSLPDGCEHILPSLNLALLYIDQLNFTGAKKSLDNFEACFTQYPLRNDEEHRALLHLGRGRIDLQTGKIDSAIDHFEAAVDRRQWFGKIGTNEDDLAAASLYSLGQALKAKNIALRYKITDNIWDSLNHAKIRWQNYLRSWWLWRKASQILAEDLNDFEDLNVRHTDTMLEYTTLGSLLSLIPNSILAKKILKENRSDPRHEASIYYKAYLGESELRNGNKKHGLENINQALESAREPYDNLLTVHLLALKALYGDNSQEQINRLVTKIYSIHPPSVRNYGLKLPISFAKIDEDISEDLLDSAFIHQPESKLIIDTKSVGSSTKLVFNSSSRPNIEHTINKDSVTESLNEFIDKIFSM